MTVDSSYCTTTIFDVSSIPFPLTLFYADLFRGSLVSSEGFLEGKFFVEFVALIFLSYLKKRMEEQNLFKIYTMLEVFDELDVIEAFQEPGLSLHVGEVLQKQEDLYRALGVQPLLAHP